MRAALSFFFPVAVSWVLLAVPARAAAQSWNSLFISDSLRKGARAVTREDEIIFEIKSPGKAIEHEHHVYTILDEAGDNLGGYTTWYDRFNTINSVTGILYDATGKELKHVKKKDMEDKAAYD